MNEILLKKAQLMKNPVLLVNRDFVFPFPLSRSTAGPGAGSRSVAVEFGDQRIKMKVLRKEKGTPGGTKRKDGAKGQDGQDEPNGPDGKHASTYFTLRSAGSSATGEGVVTGETCSGDGCSGYTIYRDGKPFLANVRLIPTIMHAPEQAFINIDARCAYECAFCASPELENFVRLPNKKWVEMIAREAGRNPDLKAAAVTSGVPGTVQEQVDDICEIVRGVRERLPGMPVGVEPYVECREQIQQLKDAGAEEMKINIQSFDRDIFSRVCPGMDWDRNLEMLSHAVSIFGRGRVVSNIIIGLGESRNNILEGIEHLAGMGVIASIRLARVNDLNRKKMENALKDYIPEGGSVESLQPSTEEIVDIALRQRSINRRHGLHPGDIKTMCHRCGCCDLSLF